MASQESIALFLMSLSHRVVPNLFFEPPQRAESYVIVQIQFALNSIQSAEAMLSNSLNDSDQLSMILRKLYQKISKTDFYAIYCYYEFGLAVINRLNELIEKEQKKARNKLNMKVQRYLPADTSLVVAKDKIKKAKKIIDIFGSIENEGVTGLKPEEDIVRCDVLGEGITRGIFKVVLDDDLIIGLGVLDDCDLFSVVPALVTPKL
ncbi:6964_t:CDS:2, partial [Funneliformis geosporum]